jgi:hypothetical protein
MKTLSLAVEGTFSEVPFYGDDTIGRVRELIAIAKGSHPDRLFIQVRVTLPEGYYGTPKEWLGLFFRLSRDGQVVSEEALRTYVTEIRTGASSFPIRTYTKDQWEAVDPVTPIRDGGQEWHILGAKVQTILPLPPRDVQLPTSMIPLLSLQSLYETLHKYPASELRITELPADPSDAVLRAYFPMFRPESPPNLDASKASILKAQEDLGKLLALPVKAHTSSVITKAKWFIPLNATRIASPRTQFEQIFYGLTLSKETPYIAYYTAETSALRSKFYVEDPKTKTPVLDTSLLRGWYETTKPSRRRPTLLLYRGSARGVFQRIAITSVDITIDIRKAKTSTAGLDDMKAEADAWIRSLDAVVPFLDTRDLTADRWELMDMSLVASYAKEVTEFDMLRFPCLQSVFGEQAGTFRLLRSEQASDAVSRRVVDACQKLNQEGAVPTADYLATELETSVEDAAQLLEEITTGDINCDRALRDYPTLKLDRKEIEVNFATDPERILAYADILRTVLTTDSDAVNAVCPRRKETVAPMASVPQEGPAVEEEVDEDLLALLGVSDEPAPAPAAPEPVKKSRKLKIADEQTNTQNYFNERLKTFNAELFATPYSKECEKSQQVIVLTPEQTKAIREDPARGEEYTYETAPEGETLEIPGGTAMCPPFWCMTDEIPLRENQLVPGDDGLLHCPVCNGKVRPNDKVSTKDFSVIKRETSKGKRTPYPKFMKKRDGVPCCYPTPRKVKANQEGEEADRDAENRHADETYILNEDSKEVPPERAAKLSTELSERLHVPTSYATSVLRGRLEFGASDLFRIGLGRPSKTLPRLLRDHRRIPPPSERPDLAQQCSFFSTSRSKDPIKEFSEAFVSKTLDPLDELEYLSFVLAFGVILVNPTTFAVRCGFRTAAIVSKQRTLIVFSREDGGGLEVLGSMKRERKGKGYATTYEIDRVQPPLDTVTADIVAIHQKACSAELPSVRDAWSAAETLGFADLGVLTDPNGLYQAFLFKGRAIIPFVSTSEDPAVRFTPAFTLMVHALAEDDLPSYTDQVSVLKQLEAAHRGLYTHAKELDHRNAMGQIVEIETVTRFRIPVRPEASPGPVTEVLETVRAASSGPLRGEQVLVRGAPDPEGRALKDTIDYASELFEFLLLSLATDLQTDGDGEIVEARYAPLRTAVEGQDKAALKTQLDVWYAAEAYETKMKTPYQFLSKVRTPCGQLTDEATCSKSSLCGWRNGDCKVQVRSTQVKPKELLERIRSTLLTNAKLRALVLDNRMSPFFSTVLYLEMPNEWITTSY